MSHARTQHPNAVLTPTGRRRMIDCLLRRGWGVVATAERFQVDAKTVRKWRDRFLAEGPAGLQDRSSRPHRSRNRTSPRGRREVIRLRTKRRWGADHIAHETGLAASTVQSILRAEGLGRLDRGDRATDRAPVRRYQRDRPGRAGPRRRQEGSPASPTAAAGASTAEDRHRAGSAQRSVTGSSIPPSTTAPDWPTQRSTVTNKPPPPSRSGAAPSCSSLPMASASNRSSPTTDRATDPGTGDTPSPIAVSHTNAPAPTGLRPMGRGSTGSCSRNGPTSGPGPQTPSAEPPTTASSTSTITTHPTAHSAGQHPSPHSPTSPRTTSPRSTPSRARGDRPRQSSDRGSDVSQCPQDGLEPAAPG